VRLLSPMEERVLRLRARGLTALAAGGILGLSEQTVKNHTTSVYDKLDVNNLAAAMCAIGWVTIPGEDMPAYTRCDFVGQCSRPYGHRGHHGGFREVAP